MSRRPIDPFANQMTCVRCKFFQVTGEPSPDGRADHTIYFCTQATPHVLCDDNRQAGGACGPDGKLWIAKA